MARHASCTRDFNSRTVIRGNVTYVQPLRPQVSHLLLSSHAHTMAGLGFDVSSKASTEARPVFFFESTCHDA